MYKRQLELDNMLDHALCAGRIALAHCIAHVLNTGSWLKDYPIYDHVRAFNRHIQREESKFTINVFGLANAAMNDYQLP